MTKTISTAEVRQKIGDLLNRVALRKDEFVIERKGKPMAALVSIERLEQLRRIARQGLSDFLATQSGGALTDAEASTLALEAQRWARAKRPRKSRSKNRP
jgi:prevent-host-death family protein